MSLLAPTLQAFFTQRLTEQLQASPNTIAAYRDTFRLLLGFAQQRTRKAPSKLELSDLDAPLIGAFLEHLESTRGNSVRTRNARLAAIHSMFRFAALRHPDHAALIQRVLAIPDKRCDRATVAFLDRDETAALLTAPDRSTWIGRRDHALLVVALQTGLRVSELTRLRCEDVQLGVGAHLACHGKRRKQRCTPLTAETVAVLRVWLQQRQGQPADPLFPSRRGTTLSRDAVSRLLTKHTTAAAERCSSLQDKKATPHVLRHTCAMELLQAGVDTTVIALWLGHEDTRTTTSVYLHADLAIKERALARVAPRQPAAGRYRPPDALLHFLEAL
jgi:integrase/recombinase XerD